MAVLLIINYQLLYLVIFLLYNTKPKQIIYCINLIGRTDPVSLFSYVFIPFFIVQDVNTVFEMVFLNNNCYCNIDSRLILEYNVGM